MKAEIQGCTDTMDAYCVEMDVKEFKKTLRYIKAY